LGIRQSAKSNRRAARAGRQVGRGRCDSLPRLGQVIEAIEQQSSNRAIEQVEGSGEGASRAASGEVLVPPPCPASLRRRRVSPTERRPSARGASTYFRPVTVLLPAAARRRGAAVRGRTRRARTRRRGCPLSRRAGLRRRHPAVAIAVGGRVAASGRRIACGRWVARRRRIARRRRVLRVVAPSGRRVVGRRRGVHRRRRRVARIARRRVAWVAAGRRVPVSGRHHASRRATGRLGTGSRAVCHDLLHHRHRGGDRLGLTGDHDLAWHAIRDSLVDLDPSLRPALQIVDGLAPSANDPTHKILRAI